MSATLKKLPHEEPLAEGASILLIGAFSDDLGRLRGILRHEGWRISACHSCEEAAGGLQKLRPSLVICDRELRDGGWKTVLSELQHLDSPPPLVVTCRHADESLWAEVLNAGGYDVLQRPFEPKELVRVLKLACRENFGVGSATTAAGMTRMEPCAS